MDKGSFYLLYPWTGDTESCWSTFLYESILSSFSSILALKIAILLLLQWHTSLNSQHYYLHTVDKSHLLLFWLLKNGVSWIQIGRLCLFGMADFSWNETAPFLSFSAGLTLSLLAKFGNWGKISGSACLGLGIFVSHWNRLTKNIENR